MNGGDEEEGGGIPLQRAGSSHSVRGGGGGEGRQSGIDVLQSELEEYHALKRQATLREEGGEGLGGGGEGAFVYEYEYYSDEEEEDGSGVGGDEFVMQLPDLHYFRLHLIYFAVMTGVGTFVLWGLESSSIEFWDALFTTASALTVTGLTVSDFSAFRPVSQAWVLILIFAGGIILTTYPSLILKRQRILVKRYASLHTPEDLRFYDIEYAALGRLLLVIPATVFSLLAAAFVIMGLYMQFSDLGSDVVDAAGINPWWWSGFHTLSAFNNAGFSLLQDNLVQLRGSVVINVVVSILIICGNTGFPVLLYSVIWTLRRTSKYGSLYQYLLDNPRWYILLFPGIQTKMFAVFSLGLLLPTSILFLIVETQRAALSHINGPTWILVAVFHSISTRTAGFNTVDMGAISFGILMLYIVMMYIRPYPIAGFKSAAQATGKDGRPGKDTLVDQLQGSLSLTTRSMLIRNSLWLFFVILAIFIVESSQLSDPDQPGYSPFKVVFEVFSAFGNVGLSMGFPGAPTSYVGALSRFSQILVISVMYMGRHRGLAASLHNMEVEEEEREEAKIRHQLQLVQEAKLRFIQKHMLSSKKHHHHGPPIGASVFSASLRRHSVQ